jgi:uncharacterized protein YjbI with pentapeptide repeats
VDIQNYLSFALTDHLGATPLNFCHMPSTRPDDMLAFDTEENSGLSTLRLAMQQPSSTTPLSQTHNRYPDSLYLELAATPVFSGGTDIEQIDLYLKIDCHEQWQPINAGRVKFGFKGGELKIQLENGKMPTELRQLSGWVQLSADKTPQSSVECQVLSQGEAESPVWIWQGKTGMSVLQGSLPQTKLGTVQVMGQPWCIEAVFTVSPGDVYLTSVEGLWSHTISPNQLAVLERKLVLFLLESKLKPYLSRVVWHSDQHPGRPKTEPLNTDDPTFELDTGETEECPEIADVIQRVITAETDNFLELAKIAGLNPLVDFAGAKLLGVNLSGVDLSGANLRRVYLRGADLSDTDLSGADLQAASLGGADLSGAYLSDANLSHANFHRASLALANVSSANLSSTNLSEANFSSANLSDANLTNANLTQADLHRASLMLANLSGVTWLNCRVEEARFSKDSGLSEEWKLDLKQRGAIFEE